MNESGQNIGAKCHINKWDVGKWFYPNRHLKWRTVSMLVAEHLRVLGKRYGWVLLPTLQLLIIISRVKVQLMIKKVTYSSVNFLQDGPDGLRRRQITNSGWSLRSFGQGRRDACRPPSSAFFVHPASEASSPRMLMRLMRRQQDQSSKPQLEKISKFDHLDLFFCGKSCFSGSKVAVNKTINTTPN